MVHHEGTTEWKQETKRLSSSGDRANICDCHICYIALNLQTKWLNNYQKSSTSTKIYM